MPYVLEYIIFGYDTLQKNIDCASDLVERRMEEYHSRGCLHHFQSKWKVDAGRAMHGNVICWMVDVRIGERGRTIPQLELSMCFLKST